MTLSCQTGSCSWYCQSGVYVIHLTLLIFFKEGDRVFVHCLTGSGTYSQFTVCNQESVHKLHANLSFSQGAALGTPYFTAYRALFNKLVFHVTKLKPFCVHNCAVP